MVEIETLDLKKLPKKEAIAAIKQIYGWPDDDAEFYYAIITGAIPGDIIDTSDPKMAKFDASLLPNPFAD